MKRLLVVALLAALPMLVGAQNLIQGIVKDVRNDEPLIGAIVTCKDLNTAISTNLEGRFVLLSPASAKKKYHIITVKYLGYKPNSKAVEINPDDNEKGIILDFNLEPDPLVLKDVTITANKVKEDLQDVPIAATVVDRINLKRRTVADTEEAFAMIPNLVSDSYLPSRASFSLRGLSSDFENIGIENSVGLYIDDVFYSRSFNFNQTLMDIERVEVLRGPQGTIFGKNTIGGVLHVISEEPKMANFTSVELNVGNLNYIQARVKGNMQLIKDKMAIRMTGAYRKRDGWLLHQNPEVADQNGVLFYGGRVSMLYKPNKSVEINIRGTFAKDDKADFTTDYKTPENGIDIIEVDSTSNNHFDRVTNQNEEGSYFERRSKSIVARIDAKLTETLTLTGISAFTGSNSGFFRDLDATEVPVGGLGRMIDIAGFSQEIRIATPRKDRKVFFIGGIFFQHEALNVNDSLVLQEGFANVLTKVRGISIPEIPGYAESLTARSNLVSTSVAGFSSTSVEVTDRVRVNAGFRATMESKGIAHWQTCDCLLNLLQTQSIGSKEDPILKDRIHSFLSGNVGVDFKTTDNMLLYLNLSRGFKGAGFNTIFTLSGNKDDAALLFEPEFVNSFEFGFKVKSGNRYTFNGAAFITNFKNKQETVVGNGGTFILNAESVQGQGLEGEFVGVWNKFLKTEIALGVLNLRYTNFPYINPTTGVETNLSGSRASKAPDFTFKFSPEIHTSLGRELKLLFRLDFNYIGKTYHDIFNTEGIARQGAGTLNGRLSIASKNERFSVAIWGKNLTNTAIIQHGWTYIFGDVVALNPPTLLGVEFRANIY